MSAISSLATVTFEHAGCFQPSMAEEQKTYENVLFFSHRQKSSPVNALC